MRCFEPILSLFVEFCIISQFFFAAGDLEAAKTGGYCLVKSGVRYILTIAIVRANYNRVFLLVKTRCLEAGSVYVINVLIKVLLNFNQVDMTSVVEKSEIYFIIVLLEVLGVVQAV